MDREISEVFVSEVQPRKGRVAAGGGGGPRRRIEGGNGHPNDDATIRTKAEPREKEQTNKRIISTRTRRTLGNVENGESKKKRGPVRMSRMR